jgi:hypothetical protein
MRADEEQPAYEEVYAELIEATLSSLATVDTPESASSFVTRVAQQIRDLSARIPEFYALEFLAILKDAVVSLTDSEMAALKQAKNDVVARNEAVAAELNVRLHAARAAGDRAAQHALWRESEVSQAEGQARIDELTRRLHPIGLRLDALKSLRSSLESTKRGIPTDQELAPESRESERLMKEVDGEFTEATDPSLTTVDTPEPVSNFITQVGEQIRDLSSEEVYSEFTAAAVSSLATVDTPESASSFVTQVAQQIRDLSATVPEFYALEFLAILKDAALNVVNSEIAALEQAKNDVVARNEAVVAELNVRLHAARAAGDRAAQHALWRESEVSQAEGQAEVDRISRNLDSVLLRLKAFGNLRSLFESKKSQTLIDQEFATTNREADLSAKNAELPPQIAASLPRHRLIRTAVDAEVAAAEFMRTIGFADAKRTPSSADGGIDVIAAGAVAQVKTHMKPIGRPDLQRLCGVAKGRTTLFFSLEGYTPEARKWGDSEGMALFRFDLQGEASPINRAAKALMAVRVVPPE